MKKILQIFLAGLLLSFAWPVRGQFGHEWGALICGGLAAVIVSVLITTGNWRAAFAQAVIFSGLGFAIGGTFSYGSLVDTIVAADSLKDVIPELIHVFFIGALWGLLGMTFLGFGLAEIGVLIQDIAVLAVAGGGSYLAVEVLKLGGPDVYWYAASGALLHVYNQTFKKSSLITLFGTFGFVGFGLGFLIAVLILWYGSHGYFGSTSTWWQLRDQIWGFIGGVTVILAAWQAIKKNYQPVLMQSINWQRAGFIFFVSFITAYNTWNVYTKWFQSTPQVSNPVFWGAFLIVCALILAAFAIYFCTCNSSAFSGSGLNKTLRCSVLFFTWYVAILAILKSIVYTGMSAWETAFTLFIIDCVIFTVTLPLFLRSSE